MSVPTISRRTRLRRTALATGGLFALGALLYASGVPCVFARLTGLPCPGCGSTRAVLALAHGDLHGVLAYNPFGPVLALFLGVLGAQALASVFVHGDLRGAGTGRPGAIVRSGIFVVAALEILLWIARFFGLFGGPVPVG